MIGVIAGDEVKHKTLGKGIVNRGNMNGNGTIDRDDALIMFGYNTARFGFVVDTSVCVNDLKLIRKGKYHKEGI